MDPAIKLFGKTIQLGSNSNRDTLISSRIEPSLVADFDCESTNSVLCLKQDKNRGDEKASRGEAMNTKQEDEPSSSSDLEENPKTLSNDKNLSKKEDQSDQTSSTNSQDKNLLKKPDQILPCPRCTSMDTKFCYFNNYNVNQPRHFCKNCQRYWTAGGTMRNVPIGAGRRKSKNSSAKASNGTVMGLGSSSPLSESVISSLRRHESTNSSFWPYTWNSIPCQSGFPVSFYSTTTPQWGLQWVPNPSNVHPLDQSSTSSSPNSSSLGKHSREGTMLSLSTSNYEEPIKEKKPENLTLVAPKMLNIVDPSEAAKSSIWSTLDIIKNDDKIGSSNGKVGFFRGLQQFNGVNHERNYANNEEPSMFLQGNPAAFSRSLQFHEIAQ